LIHIRPLFAALIQLELIMALWLLTGAFPRARFLAAAICFMVFALAASYEAFHGFASCGCFGAVKVSPKITAVFDIAALIALWATKPKKILHQCLPKQRIHLALAIGVILSGSFWTLFLLGPRRGNKDAQADNLVVLDPQSWLNKPLEIIGDIDSGEPLRHGRWLLVFYHYDCDGCRQAIPRYRAQATESRNNSVRWQLAFIAVPPLAPSAEEDPVRPSALYLHLKLRPSHDWFATTPVVAAIQEGKVLFAADGEQAVSPPRVSQWP
jgi:hypothetical protein